ncbi:hypothetical protein [Methylobacterium sp. SI9]|uniref:hypothetical protein n=1 Tax=Methylobacterium guangdongense TaxID=3138811 RepID=UPI00313E1BEC
MVSLQALAGCGLVMAGIVIESAASRHWWAGAAADRLDARAALAVALPALGLAVMAAPIA